MSGEAYLARQTQQTQYLSFIWCKTRLGVHACSSSIWGTLRAGIEAVLATAVALGITCRVVELSNNRIQFAGQAGERCEDLCNSYQLEDVAVDGGFEFCKTLMHAYDPVVKADVMYMCDLGVAWGMSSDGALDTALVEQHAQMACELSGLRCATRSSNIR
jgi:hypothetical protein